MLLGLVMAALGTGVQAQTAGDPVAAPPQADLVGRTVRVSDIGGCTTTGVIASLDRTELRVVTPFGERLTPWADVVQVERAGDGIGDGALIGGLTALALAPLAAQGYTRTDEFAGDLMVAVATYAAIGAGIDALHQGWTRVHPARRPSSAPRMSSGRRMALMVLAGAAIGGAVAAHEYGPEGAWVGVYVGATIGGVVGAAAR
jgi:hypothetical protein